MDTRKLSLGLALLAGAYATPPQFQVSAVGGTHATLQAAVDACPATGCKILLTDAEYQFSEPVSVRNKSDIEIVGARLGKGRPNPVLTMDSSAFVLGDLPTQFDSPNGTFPVIWNRIRMRDTIVNSDGSLTFRDIEAKLGERAKVAKFLLAPGRDSAGAIDPNRPAGWLVGTYGQLPGLFQIEDSRRIQISNLHFDGKMPMEVVKWHAFGPDISQYTGLAALSLYRSLQVDVFDCEFQGWSIGVRSNGYNPGGLVSDLMNAEPIGGVWAQLKPLSNPGAVGGHRIEHNLAHHNNLFIQQEFEWDLASSVRFNRVWDNGKSRLLLGDWRKMIDDMEWENYPGGFARLFDVVYPVNIYQGNTLVHNTLDLGTQGWRASSSQLFFDNVSMRRDSVEWRELTNILGPNARNNWIAASGAATPATSPLGDSVVPFCTNANCQPLTPAWGAGAIDDKLVDNGYFGDDLGAVWKAGRPSELIRVQDQTIPFVKRTENGWSVLLPVVVEAASSINGIVPVKVRAQKSGVVDDMISGLSKVNPILEIKGLENLAVLPGVNLVPFDIPAEAKDSIWRFEMALEGTDENTGRRVHSNLGVWLVRPMGKQLLVNADTTEVQPGEDVRFVVAVKDSLGQTADLDSAPTLNALGWTVRSEQVDVPAAGRIAAQENRFEIVATAPATEGVSQVVFWASEKGRYQAVAGAAYVKVAARATGVRNRSAIGSGWKLRGVTRTGNRWNVRLQDASEIELQGATLLDASGRRQDLSVSRDGGASTLSVVASRAGTYFLKLGARTIPVALIP